MAETKKARAPPSHPPFAEMITEAIVALKERTGSSQYAITKFAEEKHKQLPPSFRKLVLYHLKKLVASGKLVKVKNSFKLPPARSAPVKAVAEKPKKPAAAVAKPKTKAKTVAKPNAKVAVKPKAKAAAKPKEAAKPKPKPKVKPAAAKPAAKAARTSTRTSPGKKVEVKAKAKKRVAPARAVKPKSVKSPVKKKAQTKKGKK